MYLPMVPGTESEQRIRLLCKFGKFSANTVNALVHYFSTGAAESTSAFAFGIQQPNFAVSIKRLNDINQNYYEIRELESTGLYELSHIKNENQSAMNE